MKNHAIRICLMLSLLASWGCPQFKDGRNSATQGERDMDANARVDLGTPEVRSCEVEVAFNDAPGASKVTMAGEFNEWDIEATPMDLTDGRWTTTLELEPGDYAYKFVIDGAYEMAIPPQAPSKWSGEVENRLLAVPNCALPRWRVLSSDVGPEGKIEAVFKFQRSSSNAALDPSSLKVTIADEPVEASFDAESDTVTISYQAPSVGKYSLRVWGSDENGVPSENNPFWLPLWHENKEFVWQDSLMYLIFTDRFRDSDNGSPYPPIDGVQPIANYMGGDFKGITDALEEGYFDEMGINLLWLSPVLENPDKGYLGGDGVNRFTGYHGYWPIKALTAESRYGDMERSGDDRLKELIDKAHERGIRVLFDVVFNHVHEDHEYCQMDPSLCEVTCTCGSPGCGWDDLPIICQFAPYLPDLNYKNHRLVNLLVDDAMRLAEKFDVDGFRVDAAKHMNHVIMRTMRRRIEELEANGAAEFYTVGETYTFTDGHGLIMNYVSDYELHGQFDFPLLYPLRDAFRNNGSFRNLDDRVQVSEQQYGDFYHWMSPFLGNHDIARFSTNNLGNNAGLFGGTPDLMAEGPPNDINQWELINKMSMAFAFLITQPGIPLIYYGDEIGLAGDGDPDNRRPMIWDWNANQNELLGRVRKLGQAYRDIEALRRGDRQQLWVDDNVYVYARVNSPGDVAIIAMNKDATTRTEAVTIPADLEIDGETLKSYTSDRELIVTGGSAMVTLDSWEYAIFYTE